MDGDLRERIAALETRVRDLERLLGVMGAPEPTSPPEPAPPAMAPPIHQLVETPPVEPSVAPIEDPGDTGELSTADLEAAPPTEWHTAAEAEPAAPPTVPPTSTPPLDSLLSRARDARDRQDQREAGGPILPPPRTPAWSDEHDWSTTSHATRTPSPAPHHRTSFEWEKLIGGRLYMAVGAIVVVIGLGLFLKLAYDQGWIGHIPPAAKCLTGAAFGLVMLGAGEIIRRKLGARASVGVSAAGLATLYGTVLAAHSVYHLFGPATAFLLLASVAALGFAIAGVANLVSLAVLALVGAYANPIIIRPEHPTPFGMPVYLGVLLVVGLALSAWRPMPFRPLRLLVWWGTVLLGTGWLLTPEGGFDHPAIALAFLAFVWAAMHTELTLAARRQSRTPEQQEDARLAMLWDRPIELERQWARVRFIATSFSTTSWCAVMGVLAARHWVSLAGAPLLQPWMVPAALCAASALLALLLAGNLRILRDVPATDEERLGAGLLTQAGALLIAAVALGLSGSTQAVAWMAMGAAAVAAGRWIRSRGLDVYGLLVLSIAAVRLITIDWWTWHKAVPLTEAGGVVITGWSVLMALACAAWAAASALLLIPSLTGAGETPERRLQWRLVGEFASIIALVLLCGALVVPGADTGSVCLAWLVLALLAQTVGQSAGIVPLTGAAVLTLAAATTGIATLTPLQGALDHGTTVLGIVVTRWLWMMLASAGAWWGATLLLTYGPGSRDGAAGRSAAIRWLFQAGAIVAVGLMALAFINTKTDLGSLGIVWIALALGSLVLARLARGPALRYFAFVPLAAASLGVAFTAPYIGAHQTTHLDWMLLMVIVAAGWVAAAALLPRAMPAPGDIVTVEPAGVVTGIAAIVLYSAFLHPRIGDAALCLIWTGLAAVMLALHTVLRRLALDVLGFAGLLAASLAWSAHYPWDWMADTSPVLAHPGLWVSGAIAGVAFAGAWWVGSLRNPARPTLPYLLRYAALAAGVLLFVSTSLEVARSAGLLTADPTARRAAVSIWWGLLAVGFIVGGFVRPHPYVRYVGLGLLATATAKALVWDLAHVPQVWRIVSFVGLGLLMLAVAVGYSSLTRIQAKAAEPKDEADHPPAL